jgi:cation-transporting ATPase E
MDSNFANMPQVVHEGRRVVNNIQKSSSLFLMKTIFSIILSWIMIIIKKPYPLQPSQLMLLEIFIIGVPSFLLAFQPNKNRIQGSFLTNLLKRTIPAGLTLVIIFLISYWFVDQSQVVGNFLSNVLNLSDADFQMSVRAVCVISLTFTGWMALVKLCQPLDTFRTVVVVIFGLICLLALQLFADFFKIIPLSDLHPLVIFMCLALIESGYFLLSILYNFLNKIKLGDYSE